MNRRGFLSVSMLPLYSSCLLPGLCGESVQVGGNSEIPPEIICQTRAELDVAHQYSVKHQYVTFIHLSGEYSLLVCVTQDRKLINLFAVRVCHAMGEHDLLVCDLAKAGEFAEGYAAATMLLVGRESFDKVRWLFGDLFAKYPEPEGRI